MKSPHRGKKTDAPAKKEFKSDTGCSTTIVTTKRGKLRPTIHLRAASKKKTRQKKNKSPNKGKVNARAKKKFKSGTGVSDDYCCPKVG